MLLYMKQYFSETLQVISIKMTCISCTDEIREKVPSFQKVTLFQGYQIYKRDVINLPFSLFEDVTDYRALRRINIKAFVLIGLFVFATQ